MENHDRSKIMAKLQNLQTTQSTDHLTLILQNILKKADPIQTFLCEFFIGDLKKIAIKIGINVKKKKCRHIKTRDLKLLF